MTADTSLAPAVLVGGAHRELVSHGHPAPCHHGRMEPSLHPEVVVYTDGGFVRHNSVSPYGHGGWAWWVDATLHDSGPYLNATSSEHVERLAVERALAAFVDDPRPLLLVCDNSVVVAALRRALARYDSLSVPDDRRWERLWDLARARSGRLRVLHTHGHGRGFPRFRYGNDEADRLATKARKAAARTISASA